MAPKFTGLKPAEKVQEVLIQTCSALSCLLVGTKILYEKTRSVAIAKKADRTAYDYGIVADPNGRLVTTVG